jgi:hypothetical protein
MLWFIAGVITSLIALTGYACVRVGTDPEK